MLETVFCLPHPEQTQLKNRGISQKQKCGLETTEEHVKKTRVEPAEVDEMEEVPSPSSLDEDFLKAPSEGTIERCIVGFIDRTSNSQMARRTCAVCACEVWTSSTKKMPVSNIPNKHLLVPTVPHYAHTLIQGILVEQRGMSRLGDDETATICVSCERQLRKSKIPSFALANNMWIGEVPIELAVLTLPEKILVAKCFPAAYVVKLYPKQKGAKTWSLSSTNSGMKGNVSTYRLNIEDIADLVDPIIMPPSPPLLSAMIGITIIGPQNLPEKTMPGFLHVKQSRIRDGLRWLKSNNPLWDNIIISEERLHLYPNNDDVPEEILAIVKYSDDVAGLDAERAGYVVEDDNEDMGK